MSEDTTTSLSGPPRLTGRALHRVALGYLATSPRPPKPIASLDLETEGLFGKFLLAGYALQDTPGTVVYLDSADAVVDTLLSKWARRYIWIAHNGARYDYKYLIDPLQKRIQNGQHLRYRLVPQGASGCIGLMIWHGKPGHETKIELRDSYALMASSLEKLTKALAEHFHKLEFDHEHVVFNPASPIHREYLKNDVLGLLEVYERYRDIILEHFGVHVGWTSASTGLKAWRHTIPRTHLYWRSNRTVEEFVRHAYYGGLVMFRDGRVHEDVVSVDVNAMYPFVQRRDGVPVGTPTYTVRERPDVYGIYRVHARVPRDTPYPLVPMHHHGVAWPTGEFETYLHSPELLFAREQGCQIDVLEGYWYDHLEYPFTDFVNKCERLRIDHAGDAVAMAVKLLGNGGGYGKFGSHLLVRELCIADIEPPADKDGAWAPMLDERSGDFVPFTWFRDVVLDAPYIKPEWAGAITTHARVELRRLARGVGFEHILYSDTDNLKMPRAAFDRAIASNVLSIGAQFGQQKIDGEYLAFRATAPKCYLFRTRESGNEWVVGANKGMPRRLAHAEQMVAAWDGQRVTESFMAGNGILQMVKRGRQMGEHKERAYTSAHHLQNWRKQSDETVRPIHLAMKEAQ